MLKTYKGRLHGNTINWYDESPTETDADVIVTFTSKNTPPDKSQVEEAFAALERLKAAGGAFKDIEDPIAWQREIRKDRPLPFRD